jgi:hypothetical protein
MAAKIMGSVRDSDLSTDEFLAQVFELADSITKDMERMVRTSELAEMPYHEYLQTPGVN